MEDSEGVSPDSVSMDLFAHSMDYTWHPHSWSIIPIGVVLFEVRCAFQLVFSFVFCLDDIISMVLSHDRIAI